MTANHAEHLIPLIDRPGKKRMLAVDGGGIRGVIAVEILAEIERTLRRETGNPDLRLGDWFHFISGCSTGAIVATGLAMGMTTDELRDIYTGYGPTMFRRAGWWTRLIFHKYVHAELATLMKERFGADTTLGSDRLRSLLMVVLRNATTDSPWPLTNNPRARFNDPALPDCNLNLPLWQVVRASTAAPTFFAPETIRFPGQSRPFVFVDGALTPYNNPAFMMYLTATLPMFRIGWKPSADELLLVSVGTGLHPDSSPDLDPKAMHLGYTAQSAPSAMMYAALNQQDLLCRAFGRCRQGSVLDGELGDMIGLPPSSSPTHCFTYMRYNVELTRAGLASLGCGDLADKPIHRLDAVELIENMQQIGRAVGQKLVAAEHFADFIDAGDERR